MSCLFSIFACIFFADHTWSFVAPPAPAATPTEQDANETQPVPSGPLPEGYTLEIWTSDTCGPCRDWKRNHAAQFGNQLKVIRYEQHATTAKQLGITRLPTFRLVQGVRPVARWVGTTSPSTIVTRAKASSSQPRQSSAVIPSTSPRWAINGNSRPSRTTLLNHLRSTHSNAARNYDLNALSTEQLQRLHDAAHNGAIR